MINLYTSTLLNTQEIKHWNGRKAVFRHTESTTWTCRYNSTME